MPVDTFLFEQWKKLLPLPFPYKGFWLRIICYSDHYSGNTTKNSRMRSSWIFWEKTGNPKPAERLPGARIWLWTNKPKYHLTVRLKGNQNFVKNVYGPGGSSNLAKFKMEWKAMLLNRLDGKRETFHHSPKAPNPCLGIWPELTKGKNAWILTLPQSSISPTVGVTRRSVNRRWISRLRGKRKKKTDLTIRNFVTF